MFVCEDYFHNAIIIIYILFNCSEFSMYRILYWVELLVFYEYTYMIYRCYEVDDLVDSLLSHPKLINYKVQQWKTLCSQSDIYFIIKVTHVTNMYVITS